MLITFMIVGAYAQPRTSAAAEPCAGSRTSSYGQERNLHVLTSGFTGNTNPCGLRPFQWSGTPLEAERAG